MALTRTVLIFLASSFLATSVRAQQTQDCSGQQPITIRFEDVWKFLSLLDTSVNMADFKEPMPLKEAFALVMEQFAKKDIDLPILVDVSAFQEINPDMEVLLTKVSFPNRAGETTLREFFREALAQISTKNATVLHRPGLYYFEITTKEAAERDRASSNTLKSLFEIYFGKNQQAPIDVLSFDYLGAIRKAIFVFLAATMVFVAWRYYRSRRTRAP
jgi:hypothetical protein